MLIVAIVTGVAAYLSLGQHVWLRSAQNAVDRAQLELYTKGALDMAAVILADDSKKSPGADDLTEIWARDLPPLPVEGGAILVKIEDAQALLNLNSVWRNNNVSQPDIAIFQQLLRTQGLSPALTESVVDWIDPDDQTRPGGAEDIDYQILQPPYRAANQPLQSVDELRLIKGFTVEVIDKLRPFVIALPEASAINVNTARTEVLAALLGPSASGSVETVTSTRDRKPFKSTGDFQVLLPAAAGANPNPPSGTYDVKSSYFLVNLTIRTGRLDRRTRALLHRPANGPVTVRWRETQYTIPKIDGDSKS
jgi:general secretion pathway protein K